MDYSWPGNIRELANAVEHAFVLCSDRQIEVSDLPLEIRESRPITRPVEKQETPFNLKPFQPEQSLTGDRLIELLQESKWNKAEVARRIGLSRASVWNYMKKWNIPLQP